MSSHQNIFKHLPLPQIKFGFCGVISLELSRMGERVLLLPLVSDLAFEQVCVALRVSGMEMHEGTQNATLSCPL